MWANVRKWCVCLIEHVLFLPPTCSEECNCSMHCPLTFYFGTDYHRVRWNTASSIICTRHMRISWWYSIKDRGQKWVGSSRGTAPLEGLFGKLSDCLQSIGGYWTSCCNVSNWFNSFFIAKLQETTFFSSSVTNKALIGSFTSTSLWINCFILKIKIRYKGDKILLLLSH